MKKLIILLILIFSVSVCHAGIDFDGADDLVNIGDPASLNISGNVTVAAWIKFTTTQGNKQIAARWGLDQSYALMTSYLNDNQLLFTIRSSEISYVAETPSTYNDGNWHFVVGVYDSSNVKISVDGGSFTVGDAIAGSIDTPAQNVFIGSYNHLAGYYTGLINEVSIWDVALTIDEIALLYKSRIKRMPLQIQPSSLKGYWPMDDGAHGISADGDIVRDLSGNGNNGTGDDGGNNTGLTWQAESVLSYP